jgi:hypothetical protein
MRQKMVAVIAILAVLWFPTVGMAENFTYATPTKIQVIMKVCSEIFLLNLLFCITLPSRKMHRPSAQIACKRRQDVV